MTTKIVMGFILMLIWSRRSLISDCGFFYKKTRQLKTFQWRITFGL
jgi:hypothetical protein